MQNSYRNNIFLAGLLHDIGKFYQRADDKLLKDYTDQHLQIMKTQICPENEFGGFGYQHTWWTYKFFLDHQNIFNSIKEKGTPTFKVEINENTEQDNLVNLAIYHHKPNTNSDLQKLIQLADWWSSGMERTGYNLEQEEDIECGHFKYKKVKLKNILSLINGEQTASTFPLYALDTSRKVFEKETITKSLKEQTNIEASQSYKNLWDGFNEQLKTLPTDSTKGFLESILLLLQKYTFCIPASTNDLAHISLYEHLKTTAAIAVSLYDYMNEEHCSFNELKTDDDKLPLLLSCWDISGIQKFIYNVSGAKAAVSLKGRSFYLQLLTDTIKQKVLDHPSIKGFSGQIIYGSGGKMFILLPNTKKCKEALNSIHQDLEKILWQEHKEQLYVNHGAVEFRCVSQSKGGIIFKDSNNNLVKDQTMSELWEAVIQAASANKFKKYRSILSKEIPFSPFGNWGNDYEVCGVTGEVGILGKDIIKIGKDDNKTPILKTVHQQIELGEALKDVDYIITFLNQDVEDNPYLKNRIKDDQKKNKHLTIPGTHIHHYLFDQAELAKDEADFRKITSVDVSRVRRINDTNFHSITALKGNQCSYGFQFYGGNKQAEIKNRNKTFEELCWVNETEKSPSTFLGVLRMDIDNLGKTFKDGIPKELRSFAAYSTLSAQLDWFFSGYLNTIRKRPEFVHTVNIIYSGGDDIFAVGRWDRIMAFAETIRQEFRAYIGDKDNVTISGGIAIVGEKFPIRMAANLAGEAEDQSKDFKYKNAVKNAFTFFGETVSWDKEYDEVKQLKEQLKEYCSRKQNPISKALLHHLMQWKSENDSFQNRVEGSSLSYKWNTAYYLKRYISRYNKEPTIKTFLSDLQTSLMEGVALYNKENYGNRIYTLVGLAARWAEMELKEFEN
ncbi:MAG: type III-A CRISPR-associated protein Cas10/Csm1 [Chitinophagales bacterium]|nr:type III-A CRISPR-associated protein Cas10/Csm1 [Chitinophagales bacterium]